MGKVSFGVTFCNLSIYKLVIMHADTFGHHFLGALKVSHSDTDLAPRGQS